MSAEVTAVEAKEMARRRCSTALREGERDREKDESGRRKTEKEREEKRAKMQRKKRRRERERKGGGKVKAVKGGRRGVWWRGASGGS